MTAVIILVVLVVGLPALGWWVAERQFWTTHRARTDQDFWTDILREHRLDPLEMRQVAAAMSWGRRLPEPRLRRAAADWATREVQRMEQNRRSPSALRRRATLAGACGVLLVGAVLSLRAVTGESGPGDLTVLAVVVVLIGGYFSAEPIEQARLRRMARRNSEAGDGR